MASAKGMEEKMNIALHKSQEQNKQELLQWIKIAFGLLTLAFLLIFQMNQTANAAGKKYSILIADKNGRYTFYDLNDSASGNAGIEIDEAGTVMVPLKKISSLMPALTYRYDSKKKTATITNSYNRHKVVLVMKSNNLLYYSGTGAKAVKKSLARPMYVSKQSKTPMAPMSVFQWVMGSTKGYQYYSSSKMLGLGYDTVSFQGIIIYNPYKAVKGLPKATAVSGISNTVKVTIPEGYSVPQVFDLLVKKGACASTASLYDSMENYDFSYYPLVAEIKADINRCFKLEGYLYPDTYEFYRLSKSQDVIGKFIRNTEAKWSASDRSKAKSMGYSVNEILTIASMIEKETSDKSMMPDIASVIYNRLNIKMKLQFDSSIYYVERYIKPNISGDINRYNSYYNTYKTAALPSGPICNPGKAAIRAALNPSQTDFLFFYSDSEGQYHFSKEYVNPNSTENQTDGSVQ